LFGILGLLAGTLLRVPVYRLSVRPGDPAEDSCRSCATPLPRQPSLRCHHCAAWLGAPCAAEFCTAAMLALLAVRFAGQPVTGAFAFLGIAGVALAQIDSVAQRLPDALTLPAYPGLLALLALAAIPAGQWTALARAVESGLVTGAAFLVIGLVSGRRLGGGDVKLAGLIGLGLGWLGWAAVAQGACLGFFLAAMASLALLAVKKASRRSTIGFGPYLLSGALIAALTSAR
jgi:leader peptidase (prepilin peptidase) / N-methyltransferase